MGLDQYAYINPTRKEHQFDDGEVYYKTRADTEFYWRKHSRLQTFMEQLWVEQGGEVDDFNLGDLELTRKDIERLQEAVNTGYRDFICSGGFFYGHQFQEEAVLHNRPEDERFVQAALAALDRGDRVVYRPWW